MLVIIAAHSLVSFVFLHSDEISLFKVAAERVFFKQAVNLAGETFSPDNRADSTKHFGKHILSEYVKDNAAKIDVKGFGELLDRITAAIEAHDTKQSAVPAAGVP